MEFAALIRAQRTFFQTGATRGLEFRRGQLRCLVDALARHESRLLAALHADLRKSPFQACSSELGPLQAEIRSALKNLSRWAAPVRRRTPWLVAPAQGWVHSEPLGVALILGPWNYPLQLLLAPMVSAVAAGNCAVLKPSELAPRTTDALVTLVQENFAEHYISAIPGGAEVAEALLRERFDKIFFTGSAPIGRAVMAAAARHLTPLTLELGGKCPAIVCADADVAQAARRIAWGKFLNAGQTCVAPDFVLVQRELCEPLVAALKNSLRQFYGENAALSPDYGRIVNARHFQRLVGYLPDGKIRHGGEHDARDLYLAPTILGDVSPNSPVHQEEIFGPILPIVTFGHLDEALGMLREKPSPLALYIFTPDLTAAARVQAAIPSGGVCVNDVISQMLGPGLPFGGLGESGFGAYHGRAGFEAFCHQRAILRRATWLDLPFRYPPQKLSLTALKRTLRFLLGD